MGQQSVQGSQFPTAASLLNGGPSVTSLASNNLLQSLMNQQAAPAPAPAPVAPAPANNNSQVTQLAQLLQSRGIDANSLAGLLRNDAPAAPAPADNTTGYSTAYPGVSTYDYGYTSKTSNYGPAKDSGKQGYRPY